MKRVGIIFVLIILLFEPLSASSKRGILIWFYSFETKKNQNDGYLYSLFQTAGASYSQNKIHKIAPLTPQSKIVQTKDGNYFMGLKDTKLKIDKTKPLFLGQILDVTISPTLFQLLSSSHNSLVSKLQYDKELNKYLTNRDDLQIKHKDIVAIKDKLLKKTPKLLDYILSVDTFVHQQLEYKKPQKRPNSAVDLLQMNQGWCGEYTKLKQALLRAAGIPTRDVYAARYPTKGLSIDDKGGSKIHAWLQSYIPDLGWVSIPSTRKLYHHYQFVKLRGGYYIRALDLYKHKKEIQTISYSNTIKRVGGIRGNGIFVEIEPKYLKKIQYITSKILDYKKEPDAKIVTQIEQFPHKIRALLYWFLIASSDETIANKAAKRFLYSLNNVPTFNLQLFYINSSSLVKSRINKALKSI